MFVLDLIGRDNGNGEFNGSVIVALNVNRGRSLRNEYRVDDGEWRAYQAPFVIARQGAHIVFFRTLDEAGNVLAEAARLVIVKHGRAQPLADCSTE